MEGMGREPLDVWASERLVSLRSEEDETASVVACAVLVQQRGRAERLSFARTEDLAFLSLAFKQVKQVHV